VTAGWRRSQLACTPKKLLGVLCALAVQKIVLGYENRDEKEAEKEEQ